MTKQMSPETKKKIADAQAKRWAAKKEPLPPPAIQAAPAPQAPPPPNPTVVAFQQQLVPLVEKREIIQQHVRQSQRGLQELQMQLADHQQALQDTENAIQYRLNMISQLTGQPQMQMPQSAVDPIGMVGMASPGPRLVAQGYYQVPVNEYRGPEVNLMGNPNIPPGVTSIPAPQNQRYASGYVSSGPDNPRSESAVDVRNDPATHEMARAIVEQRKAQAAV